MFVKDCAATHESNDVRELLAGACFCLEPYHSLQMFGVAFSLHLDPGRSGIDGTKIVGGEFNVRSAQILLEPV